MDIRIETANLVKRARAGDQNAMAMIRSVRDSAMKGGKRSKESYNLIMQYIKAHPMKALQRAAVMGDEGAQTLSTIKTIVPPAGAPMTLEERIASSFDPSL